MSRFKPELILGFVLLGVFLAVCHWQAPGDKVSADEIDAYVGNIERLSTMPSEEKRAMIAAVRAWAIADDGQPVHMLNLMRYHDRLEPWPGVQIDASTPAEANEIYEDAVTAMAIATGPVMAFAGAPQSFGPKATNLFGSDARFENFDRVLVVRQPSRRAFLEMISSPEFLAIMPYKFAAVDLVLVPMTADTVMPDLRLLTGMVGLILLLAFGWLRAIRMAQPTLQSRSSLIG